jgi:signal peptidase I
MMGPGDVYAVLACGLARDVVRNFGEVRLRALGTSMVPSILPGDLISIQCASMSQISPGEVVLFEREGRLFAHRVMGSAGGPDTPHLITRGDRLCYNDPPVFAAELLGRVTSIERGSRQMQPPDPLTGWKQLFGFLLRSSDHATYFYVHLAARWSHVISRRAECRA